MPQITWRMDFSFGHLLTIITMVSGLFLGWQTLVTEVQAHTNALASLDKRVTAQEQRYQQLVDAAQADRIRQTEILAELRTDIKYLRQTLTALSGEKSTP